MTRHEERIEAFKIIFQNLFVKKEYINQNEIELPKFCNSLINLVDDNKNLLIEKIKKQVSDEKFSRIYHIDLAIILLALAEIEFSITPKEVAVNEAVEIAKEFSTEESPNFINGFLKAMVM